MIVAHQDDDLLFMQPDIGDALRAGTSLAVVYVTAGDAAQGVGYAATRIRAIKSAYAAMSGQPVSAWSCGYLELDGHVAQHCTLPSASVSLVFLGYPDGGIPGDLPGSLLQLWQGDVERADTIAEYVARYDQAGLIAAVARAIAIAQPVVIRTLDISSNHGTDHSDHLIVGSLAVLARARAGSAAALISYRGYNDAAEPANVFGVTFDEASLGFRSYEACQVGCGECERTACETIDDPNYNTWMHRRYATAARGPARGRFALAERCATVVGSAVALGDCADATEWMLDATGTLRAGDRCAVVGAGGPLEVGDCRPRPNAAFVVDAEGRIWAGVPPPPAADMISDHAVCLYGADDVVRAGTCGAFSRDPRWEVIPRTTRSVRALVATGRGVRIGRIDQTWRMCGIEQGALRCAAAEPAGGFAAAAARVDDPSAALAIEPTSLVLADVDGDGRGDACGRDAGGILCATAASGFVAVRWTTAFASSGSATTADRTLVGFDVDGDQAAELCAITAGGMACAGNAAIAATVLTAGPSGRDALFAGDLDGDRRDDWCVATPDGPACALASHREAVPDGLPWAFSQSGSVEGAAANDGEIARVETSALVDISHDGRADLCQLRDLQVDCAISQGRGFGPRQTVVRLPTGHPTALWAADRELCVDDGPDLVCARF